MALDLGTLIGYLDLDDSKFNGVLDKLPDGIKGSSAGALLATGAMATGIGLALNQGLASAINTEAANDKLSASLGLNGAESARLGGVAGKLYADAYGEGAEDINGALEAVVSSIDGMRTANASTVEDMTAKLFNLRSAFDLDVGRAAQVAGQMVKSGLAEDGVAAADLLTAALQRVPAAVREDLVDAIDEYGPFMAQIGLDGEASMGLLVKASEKGMYGIDKTGDAIKEFGIRATDMSKATGGAYTALGMDQTEMTNRLLAGGESAKGAFGEIVRGIQSIKDPSQQSQAALALFGTPLEDLSVTEIPKFLEGLSTTEGALGDVAGAADKMGEQINGNAKTGWLELTRTFEGFLAQVGSELLPVLQELLDWALANPAVLQAVAGAVGILALGFVALSVATWAMNTALLASPITWAIIGIVALIGALLLLQANWDSVVAWVTEIWGGFVAWMVSITDGLQAWWREMWAGFGSWVGEVWTGFVAWISGVWSGFVSWLMGVGAALSAWWVGMWAGFGGMVSDAWAAFTGWIMAVFLGYVGWLMGVGASLAAWWSGFWAGVVRIAVNFWQRGFVDPVVSIVTGLFNFLRAGFNAVNGFLLGIWSGIRSGAVGAFNGLVSFVSGIPGQIMAVFSGAGSWLFGFGKNIVEGLLSGVRSLAGTIGSFFLRLLPGWIVGPFKAAMGIASPSKLFRQFGVNTVEGYLLGIGDEQSALDATMAGLVSVPSADWSTSGSGALGEDGATTGRGGVVINSRTTIGNVGWDADELERREARRLMDALALAGVDEIGVS